MPKGTVPSAEFHGRLLTLTKQGQYRRKAKRELLKNLSWQIRAHQAYADRCLAKNAPEELARAVFLIESLLQIREIVEKESK